MAAGTKYNLKAEYVPEEIYRVELALNKRAVLGSSILPTWLLAHIFLYLLRYSLISKSVQLSRYAILK